MEIVHHRKNLGDLLRFEPAPWKADAKCQKMGTEHFFAKEDGGYKTVMAKAICSASPVKVECLDYAMRNIEVGIWGGTTSAERLRDRDEYLARKART